MPESLPSLILTGASGIVGRNFLEAAQDRFLIYAIARRPQRRAGVPFHPNILWIQVDIANREILGWAPTPVDSLYDEESGRELEKIVDRLNAFYRPGDTTAVDLPSS